MRGCSFSDLDGPLRTLEVARGNKPQNKPETPNFLSVDTVLYFYRLS